LLLLTSPPDYFKQTSLLQATTVNEENISFAASTVRRSKSSEPGGKLVFTFGRLTATAVTVEQLLQIAFNLPAEKIVDRPNWVNRDLFDVSGVVDPESSVRIGKLNNHQLAEIQRTLIINLLADRFGFRFHFGEKVLSFYELQSVGKSGRWLPIISEESDVDSYRGHLIIRSSHASQDLALFLTEKEDRVVLDRTGRDGAFEIKLAWSEDDKAAVSDDTNLPSLVTALKDQLGVRLVPRKGPIQVMVLDQINQPQVD